MRPERRSGARNCVVNESAGPGGSALPPVAPGMLRGMPRIAFRLWLKDDPEGIDTYVKWHLDPFDGLYDLIRAVGIKRYTIWLDGTDLFLTREGDTPESGETLDMADPVHAEWAATMKPLFQPRVAESGATRPAQIYAFDADAEPGPVEGQMTYRAGLQVGEAATDAVTRAWSLAAIEISGALRRAGVHRAWAFLEDGSLWTYLEADSLDAMERTLATDPDWTDLWARISEQLDEQTAREGWCRTREVFRCD